MKKKRNQKMFPLTAVVVMGFLFVFSLADALYPDKARSELENRPLAQSPTFTVDRLVSGKYTLDYEEYINDQFLGRDFWIDVKAKSEGLLLKVENNDVIYGKSGRLYGKYLNVPDAQLEKNIDHLLTFFSSYGGEKTLGIIPNAYALMKDDLPLGLNQVDQQAGIQSIYQAVEEKGIDCTLLDIYGAFSKAEDPGALYYRTDHHWTIDGAVTFLEEYCREKGFSMPDLTPYKRVEVEGFYGTYFSKSKNTSVEPDVLSYYDIPLSEVIIGGEEKESWLDTSALETRDKYGAFLYGNQGLSILKAENADSENPSRLLVIKDSYSNCLAPLFTLLYDEVYLVDLRSMPAGFQELLSTTEFDDVLFLYNYKNFASDTNFYRLSY